MGDSNSFSSNEIAVRHEEEHRFFPPLPSPCLVARIIDRDLSALADELDCNGPPDSAVKRQLPAQFSTNSSHGRLLSLCFVCCLVVILSPIEQSL